MTCVTCDGTGALPHTHSLSPHSPTAGVRALPFSDGHSDPHAHLSGRLGDVIAPGSLAVLWRGMDMTAQCVEAFAGPEGVGWVEIRTMPEPGRYTLHPPAERATCVECGTERSVYEDETAEGELRYSDECPTCETSLRPRPVWPAHTQTTIRHGATVIVRGVELTTHPARRPAMPVSPDAVVIGGATGDDVIRDKIQAMVDAGVILPTPTLAEQPPPAEVVALLAGSADVKPGPDLVNMGTLRPDGTIQAGPPDDAALEQLRALGWTIEPPPVCDCVITDGAEAVPSITCPIHNPPAPQETQP